MAKYTQSQVEKIITSNNSSSAVDKESMKQISEVMLAATVSVEEAAGALKEIVLSWSSAEYNSNGEFR